MGMIKIEDIVGYRIAQQGIVCCDCASREEESEATQNDIITVDDVESEESRYFCDRCGDEIG